MARRSDHTREELKNLILSSASRIIEDEGYSALTVRKIATDIGYTPGTLYNVFQSMDGLTLALNAETLERLLTVLAETKAKHENDEAMTTMKAMAHAYRDFASQNRERWLMLFMQTNDSETEAPDWFRDKIAELFQPLENALAPYYETTDAQTRKLAARSLWASIHGIYFLKETGKLPLLDNQDVAEDMTDTLIETFVEGLRK